jgi:hypothetical protein
VAVDDRQLHLLAHSPHANGVDDLREQSIIKRAVDGPARDWVFSFGVEEALAPVRMAANPAISALPRVCAPIRCRELLLGFLFVIDEDELMTGAQIELCARAAREAGDVLYEERFLRQRERSRNRQLTRQLLEGDAGVRGRAASTLISEGVLSSQSAFAVSIGILELQGSPANDLGLRLAAILDSVRRALPPKNVIGQIRPRQVVLLIETAAVAWSGGPPEEFNAWLRDLSDRELAPASAQSVVGRGEDVSDLTQIRDSHEHADAALAIAARVPRFERVLAWKDAGFYRVLARLPLDQTLDLCHPGLVPLLEHRELVRTLDTYLDLAGDAKATAEALGLHRASLYYRLQKVEQIAGVSLKSGEDRLALHLGLKLLRLAGAEPEGAAAQGMRQAG